LNEPRIKQALYLITTSISAKDSPTFIGETALVRVKLDEKRILRSGSQRLEDGTTRRTSRHIRLSNEPLIVKFFYEDNLIVPPSMPPSIQPLTAITTSLRRLQVTALQVATTINRLL
jgi:hypothetical protein